jgi:hypothetical protein
MDLNYILGAAERTRTSDPIITNDVLYHLSYSGDIGVILRILRRFKPLVQANPLSLGKPIH